MIGYLEPHARADTEAQAEGLPRLARRRVSYKDVVLEELDLPALLARRPEVALIDELAHTNAPGVEHGKRYEDVQDVLAAGIDVYSTVNVQHLESLNDQVAEVTGVRVRETLPDQVLSAADEVVLVDITPPALIERLRAGKVYRAERVPSALNGFFRVENLEALREVALRQVAEDVEQKRLREVVMPREDRLMAQSAPQAVGERLLALVTLQPSSQRVVRRAWRSAQRLGADLDVLTMLPPTRDPTPEEREQLEALRRLASLLGVQADRGARRRPRGGGRARGARPRHDLRADGHAAGAQRPRAGSPSRWSTSCCAACRAIDVRIVADRSKRKWVRP